jgi:mRNA interferase ChpB
MVCPVSSGLSPNTRDAGFLVSLMGTGPRLHGNVHCHQLKTIDWESRKAVFVEQAADVVVQAVIDRIIPVLEDD